MIIPETLFTGKNPIFLEEITSTNTYAMDMIAKTNPPEGTCIYTAYQSAGRGQIGRFWHSSAGKNLLISYILYPKMLLATDQFFLNIISGLAVMDVVATFHSNVKIKWPNDIYVGDRKIAGILVQNILRGSHIKATVIGIGLNVNEDNFPSYIPNPISISQCTLLQHHLDDIRQLLSSKLEFYYLKMKSGHLDWLKSFYIEVMYRRNEHSQFIAENGQQFFGAIQGINSHGKLLIKLDNQEIMAFGFREISYVI